MTGPTYSGPLTEVRKQLWRLRRHGRRGSRWRQLPAAPGTLAWGHPESANRAMTAFAMVFAVFAWYAGDGKFDTRVWPLWAMTGLGVAGMFLNFVFVERFVIDARARRWCHERGWRGRVREESGPYEDLAGLVLEEFRRGPLNPNYFVLVLEFADGVRFCDLSRTIWRLEEARAEARRIATTSGLPLVEKPLPK